MTGNAMRRREFITLLGGAAAAWPVAARAQQRPTMPVIGYLHPGSPDWEPNQVAAFRRGLSETGYVEGRNVTIEYRWAHNDAAKLVELATELVRVGVAVISSSDSTPAALAAKAATTTIPIVFIAGADPVQTGLVASLNRPGGNATGMIHMNAGLGAKRLGLLHELLPAAGRIAALVGPNSSVIESMIADLQEAATTIGRPIEFLAANNNREIDAAFAGLVRARIDALIVSPLPLFSTRRVQIITQATRHAVPTIFPWREDVLAGGLMSYGPSITDQFRLAGIYTGRILKGEKPANLPVQRPTKFEFVINLQTAKVLGLTFPPGLLAIADEVIE